MDGINFCKYNADSLNPKPRTINHVGDSAETLLCCFAGFSSGSRCQQKLTEGTVPSIPRPATLHGWCIRAERFNCTVTLVPFTWLIQYRKTEGPSAERPRWLYTTEQDKLQVKLCLHTEVHSHSKCGGVIHKMHIDAAEHCLVKNAVH